MRYRVWLAPTVLVLGCAHEAPMPKVGVGPSEPLDATPTNLPAPPPQYVVGDPARPSPLTTLALPDGSGVVIEGQRFVIGPSGVRSAHDVADAPLQAAFRVPARLGGGFLFRAKTTLYAAPTFDGLLRPLVTLPIEVTQVSFGPSSLLVRADSGERWMLDLKTGARQPLAPAGLLDVAALDDGRAAALVEGNGLLVSSDGGGHWTDATASLRSPARRVFVDTLAGTEPGLWIEEQSGQAARLMVGGRLAEYDELPKAEPLAPLRTKPTEWREDEPPLRRAVRLGAPLGDGAALVVSSGDLVKVDLATGALTVVAPGRLPPDAMCAGTRTADDVVFTCGRNNGTAFVVSHALEGSPVVEQSFQEAGRFVVADDGGIAFLGSCDKPTNHDRHVACVRAPGGGWQLYDPDAGGDAGPGPAQVVVRWIPRVDGDALAVVSNVGGVSNAWGVVDGRTGELHAWPTDAMTPTLQSALQQNAEPSRGGSYDAGRLADRAWTTTPQGTLRGWASLPGGQGAIEVGLDGSVQTSAFTFDRISVAGTLALARLKDGRIWQTLDRGATWAEVAAPPATKPGGWLDAHACSLVGCDLAQWYRIGWAAAPPVAVPALVTAPPAPRVDRPVIPTLTCRASGDVRRSAIPRGDHSPDDAGLGAARQPYANNALGTDYLNLTFSRRVTGAVRDVDNEDGSSPRVLVHGLSTQPGDDRLIVAGPNRDVLALSRLVSFVPPFEPQSPVRRVPLAMRDLLVAGRAAGQATADLLRDDPVPTAAVPVTPLDPASADDLLLQIAAGGTALLRASTTAKPRFAYEVGRGDEWRLQGAVALEGDALAWLEEDSTGHARVVRLGASPLPTTAFELDGPPSTDLYPANADALAVGPRGELGLLRAHAGGEAPSTFDPAVVALPGGGVIPLAPWATATPADDPACKAEAGGWRATVTSVGPWLHVAGGADLKEYDDATMLARVRWTATRVCVEAVEVRIQDTLTVSPSGTSSYGSIWDSPAETWVVARFTGGASAGRAAVLLGGEMHQPLDCTLARP